METFKDIVAILGEPSNAGKTVGIGILVEFPLGRHRSESPGVLVTKRGTKFRSSWKLRMVSIVFLMESSSSSGELMHLSEIEWGNLTPYDERQSLSWGIALFTEPPNTCLLYTSPSPRD